MNPVRFSHETKNRTISKRKAFLDWVRKNVGVQAYQTAIKSEKEYEKMMKIAYRVRNSRAYRDTYSVYSPFEF